MGKDHQRGSSSSSRKGKKGGSEKPKQPQRGLGVAQLEKIRLHGELISASAYHYSSSLPTYPTTFNQQEAAAYSPSIVPASSFSYLTSSTSAEYERANNMRYADSQAATTPSWYPSNGMLETEHIPQPSMTRQLLSSDIEDAQGKGVKKHRSKSMGSSSQNYEEASESQELDLELRLSL